MPVWSPVLLVKARHPLHFATFTSRMASDHSARCSSMVSVWQSFLRELAKYPLMMFKQFMIVCAQWKKTFSKIYLQNCLSGRKIIVWFVLCCFRKFISTVQFCTGLQVPKDCLVFRNLFIKPTLDSAKRQVKTFYASTPKMLQCSKQRLWTKSCFIQYLAYCAWFSHYFVFSIFSLLFSDPVIKIKKRSENTGIQIGDSWSSTYDFTNGCLSLKGPSIGRHNTQEESYGVVFLNKHQINCKEKLSWHIGPRHNFSNLKMAALGKCSWINYLKRISAIFVSI